MTEPLLRAITTSPVIAISTIFNITARRHAAVAAVHAYLDTHIVVGGCMNYEAYEGGPPRPPRP
jgi:4-hydroxy-3-methylbut-2-enyl diphosphate reductase IspH